MNLRDRPRSFHIGCESMSRSEYIANIFKRAKDVALVGEPTTISGNLFASDIKLVKRLTGLAPSRYVSRTKGFIYAEYFVPFDVEFPGIV